jgi:cytochrome P450
MDSLRDPFEEARKKCPVLSTEFQGESIPMILRLPEVREAAKNWETYSSDAPRRVPIPSEENVRSVRQYPIETNPPEHTEYRKIVDPFFRRPLLPEVKEKLDVLLEKMIGEAMAKESFEVIQDFAIPLQSHALTYLLNVREEEAETWIGWGVHVFKEGDGESKGAFMEEYCQQMFESAEKNPGDDFFSALNAAEYQGRKLTMEEKLGYANLAFAGGRDTIIQTIACIIGWFAEHAEGLSFLRENPKCINTACEEFFRLFIPLTHIGRVCPHATDVHGHAVPPGGRVSLGWFAANRDPDVFDNPNVVKLDRKPNPHVAFGFGIHNCLGAHHARAIMRGLVTKLSQKLEAVELLDFKNHVEVEKDYTRTAGYESLKVKFHSLVS